MHLLKWNETGKFSLVSYEDRNSRPPYAILSHTWESDEVTFQDIKDGTGECKDSYKKIRFCAHQAKKRDLTHFWVDTCCIDKDKSTEVNEAINSMFRWYREAVVCFVYLSDISSNNCTTEQVCESLWKSKWFTRGWTLQELIAPRSVEFFSEEGMYLGNKKDLEQHIHNITKVPFKALQGSSLSDFSFEEKMAWAERRRTTREEDRAYCLFGIFGVYMPVIYGEGIECAFDRLHCEIQRRISASIPFRHNASINTADEQTRGSKRPNDQSDGNDTTARPLKTQKQETLSEEQKEELLDSLKFEQDDDRRMTIKKAHIKTCKWLLDKSEYRDWLNISKLSEHHGILWIKGKPGAGKSTLMKYALTHAKRTLKDSVIISFFFNARGVDLEKSTTGMYRSLLEQLLTEVPKLWDSFDPLEIASYNKGHVQWEIEPLKSLFEQAVMGLGASRLTCFIDALDECGEEEIRDMVSFYDRLGERTAQAGAPFRVCYASRHYPHITISKGLSFILEGQEGHEGDMTAYINSELHIGHSKIAQDIRADLQDKAAGVFMWVVLVVGILNKEHDRGRIHALRKKLREIPADLHELFHSILLRDHRNKDELLLCIQWLLFSKQPLKPEQLYFAILSGAEPEALCARDSEEITDEDILRFILDSSKGLAEFTKTKSPTVQFIHESVRDYLLKEKGLEKIWPDFGRNFEGESHERLKQCCISQLNIDVANPLGIPSLLPKASSQKAAELRQSANKIFPFLEYATENILYHADLAEAGGVSQASFLDNFGLAQWIEYKNLFERYEARRYTKKASLLYILAEHNAPALIKVHPSALDCFLLEKQRYGTPMFAALATGSNKAAAAFVDRHLRLDPQLSVLEDLRLALERNGNLCKRLGRDFTFSSRKQSVLQLVCEQKHEGFCELFKMSKKMSKANNGKREDKNALIYAAANNLKAFVHFFLNNVVDINAKCVAGRTPLSYAAENGHESTVLLLLEKGADIETKNSINKTLLCLAAGRGHKLTVRLLLEKGADIEARDNDGRISLLNAVAFLGMSLLCGYYLKKALILK